MNPWRSSRFHWGSLDPSIDGSEVDGWIASEGHRRNLLGPFNVCGIGAVRGVVGKPRFFSQKKQPQNSEKKKQKQRLMSWFGGLEKSFERICVFQIYIQKLYNFFHGAICTENFQCTLDVDDTFGVLLVV